MRYSGDWFRIGGLIVGVIGFGITRLVVAEAIQLRSGLVYLFSGLIPLVFGLGVTLFGVALAVGRYSESYTRTVAKWCTLGTLTMAFVLAVSSIESIFLGAGLRALSESPMLLANTLLAGVIGGVVIGHRTAINHRQREDNRRQANRALLLDRLLRHEVLNAVTIIRGYAESLSGTDSAERADQITEASDRIAETIDDVADLIEEKPSTGRIDVARLVSSEIEEYRSECPDVRLEYEGPPSGIEAAADHRLRRVVREPIDYARRNDEISRITFGVENADYTIRLLIKSDDGYLSDDHQRLLASGEFPEFDDPSSGFSLSIIRLLVREFEGDITVDDGPTSPGEQIVIELPKPNQSDISRAISVSKAQLVWAGVTGIVAGVVMGGYLVTTTDFIPIIGALYSATDPVVGWTTHLFHSIVFAMIFAGVHSHPRIRRFSSNVRIGLLTGVSWGVILWLFAAGVVMPLWLNVVGIPVELPNLPTIGLVSHIVWGAVVGITYPLLNRIDFPITEFVRAGGGSRSFR